MPSGYDITSISASDLAILIREADRAASWLARRFGLGRHDQDDIRQEIITDLLMRVGAFDLRRGSLGAFAGKIAHHHACTMASNLTRHAPAKYVDIETLDAGVGRSQQAIIDQTSDTAKSVQIRLDLEQALQQLRPMDVGLAADLLGRTLVEIIETSSYSRATIYRRFQNICLGLKALGVSPR